MKNWEMLQTAVAAAHSRGQQWLTRGEIVNTTEAMFPDVSRGSIGAHASSTCINDPSKKHYADTYRKSPLLVTDNPAMHGKRYRLLTETERATFLANPRDDLEFVSYTNLVEWLGNPSTALVTDRDEEAGLARDDEGELADPFELAGPALLEIHLQDYLHRNWHTVFPNLTLYRGSEGREFATSDPSVGILDFLCTDSAGNFVVIETKRALSDRPAVGQILGYMGWVGAKLCTAGQTVRGVLIASEGTDRLRMAVAAVPNLELYVYEISFSLRPDPGA